ncbi:probable basic-leucine zipper transcription factor I isoform X3 [Nematostella vectensis]|uniref:probable basic-leucine zipper transcription factor I isoform X3 n=1 Tax=Nematostella vectensis TaxID=45351 RepID=UPI0020771F2D|nr:probable basic-leucine zipper transcription factor I isoform X3 [Nematostella vectensis]
MTLPRPLRHNSSEIFHFSECWEDLGRMVLKLLVVVVACCVCRVLSAPVLTEDDHFMVKRWDFIENNDPDMLKIPSDCSKLVQQYTNGEMVMFEYKAKMAKCLKHKDELISRDTIAHDDSQSEGEVSFTNPDFVDSISDKNDADGQIDHTSDDIDDTDASKKYDVPQYQPSTYQYNYFGAEPQQQTAYYQQPQQQDQSYAEQPQIPQQSQAAFAPSSSFPANQQVDFRQQVPQSQNSMARSDVPVAQQYQQQQPAQNSYDRSDVPAAQQFQPSANQWQQAPDQQQFPMAKKDETPEPSSDDPFAQFMTMQQSNNGEANIAPQEAQLRSSIPDPSQAQQTNADLTAAQATQQRSDIQPDPFQAQQPNNVDLTALQATQQRSDIQPDPFQAQQPNNIDLTVPQATQLRSDIQPDPSQAQQPNNVDLTAPQATQQRSDIQPEPFQAQQQNNAELTAPQATQQRSDIQPNPFQAQQPNNVDLTAPQVNQQRSDIQADPSQAQQGFNQMPAASQATWMRQWSPEDHGLFPENP